MTERRVPVDASQAALLLGVPIEQGLVTDDVDQAAGPGHQAVVLLGPDRGRRLPAAGFAVRTWELRRTALGAPALLPAGERRLAQGLRTGGGRRRPRQVAADLVDRCRRSRGHGLVVVAHRGVAPVPRVLAAAGVGPDRPAALLLSLSSRRRAVFVVADDAGRPVTAVKTGPAARAHEAGSVEQAVLRRLADLGVEGVPAALGAGVVDGTAWSAETALVGPGLLDELAARPPEDGRRLLDDVARWLTRLAVLTRGARGHAEPGLLRGAHREAASLLPAGGAVPGVLVHGDLGAGHNVVVAAGRVGVLDWETAREGGLPLADLLPLLGTCLAAVQRARTPEQVAATVLDCCRGRTVDGPWLLARVREHLAALGVPVAHAGALGALAFAGSASVVLRHHELAEAAGQPVQPWTDPATLVAAAWAADPALGVAWPALTEA